MTMLKNLLVVGLVSGSFHTAVFACDGCGGLGGPDYDVIKTHHDTFPNFAKDYSVINTQSGDWSDPAIWSTGVVPASDAIVRIAKDFVVTYDLESTERIEAIGIEGALRFHTQHATRLLAKHILVYRNGTIEIGSMADPVQHPATAEVVFLDEPIDVDQDPSQYGNGLLVFGRLELHGTPFASTFIRTRNEPVKGDSTLHLETPALGWQVGDRLFLPDTRQVDPSEKDYVPQWEEPTVQDVSPDGLTVQLTGPLQFDHLGATDGAGQLELLPHVANQTRNVLLRSENPDGTRGHTLFAERAKIDCRYAEFRGLGRTTVEPIDNTTYDADGNVTHLGTNQIARYPIHLHHLMGPPNPSDTGYQYTLIGNAVTQDSLKWGIAIHGSHFGLIRDNVVCHVDGSGIVTEDGSETGNRIERNFVGRVLGGGVSHHTADIGDLGDAYWFRGPMNTVLSNVAVNAVATGYDAFSQNLSTVIRPNFRGADITDDLQTTTVTIRHESFDQFKGNECYGATPTALMFWAIGDRLTPGYGSGSAEINRVEDFTAWHISNQGVILYYISHMVIDGWVQRGDLSQIRASSYNSDATAIRLGGSRCVRAYVRNADIQGMQYGIVNRGRGRSELFVVEDCYLRNFVNVVVRPWVQDPLTGYRETQLKNNEYQFLLNPPSNPDFLPYHISMEWRPPTHNNINKLETVRVFDYPVSGENLELFYLEQHPDFLIPATGDPDTGCPEDNLTNQECADTYGVAIGGRAAPCIDPDCSNALSYPKFRGFVFPLDPTVPLVPDTTVPEVTEVSSVNDSNAVLVTFSEPIELDAETIAHYSLSHGVSVLSATLAPSGETLTLTVSDLQESVPYELGMQGILDRANPPNEMAPTSIVFSHVDLGNLLVDFGGSEESSLFGNVHWQSVFTDTYTDFRPVGVGGTMTVTGNNGAYNYQGIGGTPRFFAVGERIAVTWHHAGDSPVSFTPYLSLDDANRRTFEPDGTWYEMAEISMAPGESSRSTYMVTPDVAGRYSMINVNCNSANTHELVCDKIELLPPDEEDADLDQIPDHWESAYALRPDDGKDADEDTDGDGLTNREEFIALTDPLDGNSFFRIDRIFPGRVEFNSSTYRLYTLEQNRDPSNHANWSSVPDQSRKFGVGGPDMLEPPSSESERSVSYRIRVETE